MVLTKRKPRARQEDSVRNTVRLYLQVHREATSHEVVKYIIDECGMDTTKEIVMAIFYRLRKKMKLKNVKAQNMNTVKWLVKEYVEKHDNSVSYDEVINYVIVKQKRDVPESTIKWCVCEVLKASNGKLKRKLNLKQYIKEYVLSHGNCVTSEEVIKYVLESERFEATKDSIRVTLYTVLEETGGQLKSSSLIQSIREYVNSHDNCVSNIEVINYVLEINKFSTTEAAIRTTLRNVLNETGGELKKVTVAESIRNYVSRNGNQVTFEEIKNYLVVEENIKTTDKYIKQALNRVLGETKEY